MYGTTHVLGLRSNVEMQTVECQMSKILKMSTFLPYPDILLQGSPR
jgi:hypothetical protein